MQNKLHNYVVRKKKLQKNNNFHKWSYMETHFFNKTLDKIIHYVRYSLKHIDLNQKLPI